MTRNENDFKILVVDDNRELRGILEEYLLRETLILERLENERKETIKKMDKLSKNRQAVRGYTSKFPLPPPSAFFSKIG